MTNDISNNLPEELITSIKNIYKPAGILMSAEAVRESESSDYGACRLGFNGYVIVFRVAKTTPGKIGQFVTVWKRPMPGGVIAPFNRADNVEFVVVSVSDGNNRGQFVFDQNILLINNIMSQCSKSGKRAFRLYPPWTTPMSKQARITQQWQLPYFLDITQDGTSDLDRARGLFKVRK